MNFKKLVGLALILSAILPLAACNDAGEEPVESPTEEEAPSPAE